MFGKGKKEMTEAADVRLNVIYGDEADLIIEGDGRRFRLSWADLAGVIDRKEPQKKEALLSPAVLEKYVKVQRLLNHGLDLDRIAKLLGVEAADLRAFYGWANGHPNARGTLLQVEMDRQRELDMLPLIKPFRGDGNELIYRAHIVGRDLAAMLRQGDAAKALGVDPGVLDQWLKDNSAMMALL